MATMTTHDTEHGLKRHHHDHGLDHDDVKVVHHHTKYRTAALLAFVSLILLAESIYRIVSVARTPSGQWGRRNTFPPVVLLLGGVFELLYSTLGLLIGLCAILFDMESKAPIMALLGIQLLLGLYTWVVYAIAYPSYRIDKGANKTRSNVSAEVFGWVITAVGVYGLVQAAQFFLALQLFSLLGRVAKLGRTHFKIRMLVLSCLVSIAGLGMLVAGCIVRRQYKDDALGKGSNFPGSPSAPAPLLGLLNAIRYAGITIVSGILVLLFGWLGIATAMTAKLFKFLFGFGIFVWLWLIAAHVITQFGLISSALAAPAIVTALLLTALVMVPLYYGKEGHRAHDT